jgi:hypothetical protein
MIFSISNTSSHTPSLFPSSTSTNTHTHSQVIGHSHTCHIMHHTHSHHGLHHHDIIYDSHSLSMTSSKIQTQPISNSIINRDLISNHPLSLIKILIRSNSGDSHSTWKHINTPFLLFSSPHIFPQWFILRRTPFHFYSVLHMLSSFPLHLSFYSFIAYISPLALIQFYQSSFSCLGLTLFPVP